MSKTDAAMDSSHPCPPPFLMMHPLFGFHPFPLHACQGISDKTEDAVRLSPLSVPTGGARYPAVPLRQRHLPASFWQEPNRPRGEAGSASLGLGLAGQLLSQGATYRDFLAKLAAAEEHQRSLSTRVRFPITEFLYYNYGLKRHLEAGERVRGVGGPGPHRADARLWLQQEEASKALGVSLSSPAFPPALCPYLGCPCLHPSLTGSAAGKTDFWRQGAGLTLAEVGDEDASALPWKPMATKSVTTYPSRFHPFAHDR